MKVIKLFVTLLLLYQSVVAVTLDNGLKKVKQDRKLVGTALVESHILELQHGISVDRIREEISDIHKNIKLCIDEQFEKEPDEMIPFEDVMEMCTGHSMIILTKFYDDILKEIKEMTKEKIKSDMEPGYCDNILFECIEFFRILDLYIELDYDLVVAFEINRNNILRVISRERFEDLTGIMSGKVDDYNTIRVNLIEEKRYFESYLKEKKEEYLKKQQSDDDEDGEYYEFHSDEDHGKYEYDDYDFDEWKGDTQSLEDEEGQSGSFEDGDNYHHDDDNPSEEHEEEHEEDHDDEDNSSGGWFTGWKAPSLGGSWGSGMADWMKSKKAEQPDEEEHEEPQEEHEEEPQEGEEDDGPKTLWDQLREAGDDAIGQGNEQFENMSNMGADALGQVGDLGAGAMGQMGDLGAGAMGQMNDLGAGAMGQMSNMGAGAMGQMNDLGAGAMGQMGNLGAGAMSGVTDMGNNLTSGIGDGMAGLSGGLSDVSNTIAAPPPINLGGIGGGLFKKAI